MNEEITVLTLKIPVSSAMSSNEFIDYCTRYIPEIAECNKKLVVSGHTAITDYIINKDIARKVIDLHSIMISRRKYRLKRNNSRKNRNVIEKSLEDYPTINDIYREFCGEDNSRVNVEALKELETLPEPESKPEQKPELEPKYEVNTDALMKENRKLSGYAISIENEFNDYKKIAEKAIVFMNAVSCSEECINISTFHKILLQNGVTMKEREFFDWLRNEGYIKNSADGYEKNIPTEKAITSGYMTVREVVVNGSGSKPHIAFTPKITGKGQIYFTNLFVGKNAE